MMAMSLGALLLCAPLSGAASRGMTGTAQVEGLDVQLKDVIVTDKKAYAHLLWDAFPLRQSIAGAAKAQGKSDEQLRDAMVRALALTAVRARFPKALKVKIDVVEFSRRDEYGAPDWNSVKKLQHLEMDLPALKPAPKKKAKKRAL